MTGVSHEEVEQECLRFFEQNPFSLESKESLQQKLGRKPEILQSALEKLAVEKRLKSFSAGLHALYQLQQGPLLTDGLPVSEQSLPDAMNHLTKREKDIVKLLMQGKNNQEVADMLFISPNTVKNHITNIYAKLEVSDRYELISKAYQYSSNPYSF